MGCKGMPNTISHCTIVVNPLRSFLVWTWIYLQYCHSTRYLPLSMILQKMAFRRWPKDHFQMRKDILYQSRPVVVPPFHSWPPIHSGMGTTWEIETDKAHGMLLKKEKVPRHYHKVASWAKGQQKDDSNAESYSIQKWANVPLCIVEWEQLEK